MDPNTLPSPQFELPQPQVNKGQEAVGLHAGEKDSGQMTEKRNLETPATAPPAPPQQGAAPVDLTTLQGKASGLSPGGDPQSLKTMPVAANGADAEDSDLIEKAWVTKAKAIVNQTRSDPHRQNNEINKVKKEYIQKRYHKDIKLNDE